MASKDTGNTSKTSVQISQELKETRERITQTIDELNDFVRPVRVAARGLDKLTALFVDAEGEPRTERIVGTAASFATLIGLLKRTTSKD